MQETEKEKRINQTEDQHSKSKNIDDDDETDQKSSKVKYIIIGGIVLVILVLVIVLPITLTNKDEGILKTYPFGPPTPPPTPIPNSVLNHYSAVNPVNDQDSYSGFIVSNQQYNAQLHQEVLNKLYGRVQASNGNHDFGINARTLPTGDNNQYINNVSFIFTMPDYKIGFLQMDDAQNPRYQVPTDHVGYRGPNSAMRLEMLGFQLFSNPFSFSFTDVADQSNVFIHTNSSNLVFMDKFIQIDFQLPSQRLYGLGERVHEFGLGEGAWTMWAKGQDSPYDDGTGGKQVYGVHPFVLVQGKNKGDYFGMWFRNSNAQSPLVVFNDDGTSTLSYITTGGKIEIYFFIHGSAKEIIQNYQNVIGKPNLPPFWSLGWQQASWKYQTQQDVQNMIDGYKNAGIPLETVYLDIPYMNNYADFSVNTNDFPTLKDMTTTLHNNNQKLVVILDAGLSADDLENTYYKSAQDKNCLIKSSINGDQYNGALVQHVWPQNAVFLDWFHPDAQTIWSQGCKDLYDLVPYDGLWIDMNEATGFCNGECPGYTPQSVQMDANIIRNLAEEKTLLKDGEPVTSWYSSVPNQSQKSTYNLPFISGQVNPDNMAMSLNATHPSNGLYEYDVHNLFGHMMSKTTNNFLTSTYANPDNRPFILTRSSFSGTGQFASHWLGDNWRDWNYMKYSVAGMMNMNMFGIPHVGADVCGFFGQTRDDDMCSRWIQLATFYPLARAHQNLTYNGQPSDNSEPYTLSEPYKSWAKDSIFDRYQYLRHMYTCLFEANQWGGSCIDPLFFYFPDDDKCYQDVESTFMVGGAIKVSPIFTADLKEGDKFDAYFPEGKWVNLANYAEIITGGQTVQLTAGTTVNAHLKPGSIIGKQDNSQQTLQTTTDLLTAPISLIVNRDTDGMATGSLLLDQGISRSEIYNWQYEYFTFQVSSNSINKFFAQGNLNTQDVTMDKVVITNAADMVAANFACYMDYSFNPVIMNLNYDSTMKTLTLTSASGSIKFDDWKTIHYGNSLTDFNLCDPATYTYKLSSGKLPDLSGSSATFTITTMSTSSILPDVKVTIKMMTPNIINVFWNFVSTPFGQRTPFQVPKTLITPGSTTDPTTLSNFVIISDSPFKITIKSVSQTTVLDISGEIFQSWFNMVKVRTYHLAGTDFTGVYGLGERVQKDLPYADGVYTMYARDAGTPLEDGKVPGKNTYGTFPFYLFRTDHGIWTGVYHNLAQPQDWYVLNDQDSGTVDLTSVAVGGVTDIYIIVGYSPKQIIQNYWNYIVGKPVLIPFYALGWNQCRWGYHTTQDLIDVVGNYSENGIPLDVQWSDIDYLDTYRDFTYDKNRFADLPDFINSLHDNNMYWVPILDAGIAMRPWGNYDSYNTGNSQSIFIKANSNMQTESFLGNVWPNEAVYADWFNPNAGTWWQAQLQSLHNQVGFDGLWLDMNEASNFCNGICKRQQKPSSTVLKNLKYVPGNRDLEIKSISVDAYHYGNYLEIDTHNVFGALMTYYSSQYLTSQGKRPFIIERSSFAGMGKYGSRWLGDNSADLDHFETSITGIMMMGMFGIPFNGVDICGFGGNTNAELCARWTVVGAFYPFTRNHNDYSSISQEPYVFKDQYYEDGISYMDIMKQGILNKYHVLKYYYTYIYLGNQYGTGPFFNPLWFTFADDTNAYTDPQYNIMLGPALKLSGLTDKLNQNSTSFYFPKGTWCNVYDMTEKCFTQTTGGYKDYQTKAYDFYVHLFSGNIVPMQDATSLKVTKAHDLQQNPIDLHILGSTKLQGAAWYAQGSYVNDDGMTTTLTGNVNQYAISAMAPTSKPQQMTITFTQYYTAYNHKNADGCNAVNANDYLGNIYIYNAEALEINGIFNAYFYYTDSADPIIIGQATYDDTIDKLVYKTKTSSSNLDNRFCMPRISKIVLSNLG